LEIRVEIFAIGKELCYGRVYDTNSFWIADQVTQLGAKVQRITCVPDSVSDICGALREAINRNPDFIILTGGLGPTSDDLTIEALSGLLSLKVATDKEILRLMADRRGVPVDQLPPNLIKMAHSLEGAECLSNPVGWAPVTAVKRSHLTIAALPGPPVEMKACFNEHLAKRIRGETGYESSSGRVFVSMYESQVFPIVEEIMQKVPGTYLKPLVSEYQRDKGLPVEIIAFARDKDACQRKLEETIKRLRESVTQKGGSLGLP